MEPRLELRPNKTAFVAYRFWAGTFWTLVFFAILYLVSAAILPVSIWYFVAAFLVLRAVTYYSLAVQYRKTSYRFFGKKIIAKTGAILHDRETELVVRNITHVTMVKPFIENKLFGTGRILIELAGSAVVEGYLASVDKPETVYEIVKETMRENGFKLATKNLVQRERPSIVGVLFETIGILFVIIVFFLGFLGILIPLFLFLGPLFSFAVPGLVLLAVLGFLGIRFMDLLKRIYYIYDDTIVYSEGFLTKVHSFIPIENLADSEVTQTLVDKIFGLYDVRISCQGASHEILFKNLVNGPKMEENVDALINKTSSLITARSGKEETKVLEAKGLKIAPGKSARLALEESYTATLKMDMVRSIAPILLGILALIIALVLTAIIIPPLFVALLLFSISLAPFAVVIAFIGIAIKVGATTYFVKPKGMGEKFNFLNSRDVEFSNDKITGIVITRNFIDNWFGTFSARFWSIGATHDIYFANIKETQGLANKLLSKFGIAEQQPIYSTGSKFGLGAFAKSVLPLTVLLPVAIAVAFFFATELALYLVVGLAFLITVVVMYLNFFYKTSRLSLSKDFVHFSQGIFFKSYYYALYNNIKDITTIRLPFSSLGTIVFNVAGESFVQAGKNKALVSHHFKMDFVPAIPTKDELIDLVFYKRPSAQEIQKIEASIEEFSSKQILFAKPAMANPLFWAVLILGALTAASWLFIPSILPIMLAIDAIAILYIVLSVRAKSYTIEPYRVLEKRGILYKTQTSIVFTKIDHLKSYQGFTNKLFKNGSITVHTTGSRKPEITIKDLPDFGQFYQTLEKYY